MLCSCWVGPLELTSHGVWNYWVGRMGWDLLGMYDTRVGAAFCTCLCALDALMALGWDEGCIFWC